MKNEAMVFLTSSTLCIYLIVIAVILTHRFLCRRSPQQRALALRSFLDSVKPVHNSEIDRALPAQHRPFDPPRKSSLMMGLTRITPDEWLIVDRNLGKTLRDKRESIKMYPSELVVANKCADTAVRECYNLITQFVSRKYPDHYQIRGNTLVNKVLNTHLPANANNLRLSSLQLLNLLAENIEEDVLLLEPNEAEEYILRAGSFVYPAGFNPSKLLNLQLSEIHEPVPHYQERLQNPMNRIFARIKPGDYLQRLNWSCQEGVKLSVPHITETRFFKRKVENDAEKVPEEPVDVRKMFVRVERQTLSRLPESRYVLFTIRTYLYSLEDIKKEGLGESLAQSIENLDFHMGRYKGRDQWGEPIIEFLRE